MRKLNISILWGVLLVGSSVNAEIIYGKQPGGEGGLLLVEPPSSAATPTTENDGNNEMLAQSETSYGPYGAHAFGGPQGQDGADLAVVVTGGYKVADTPEHGPHQGLEERGHNPDHSPEGPGGPLDGPGGPLDGPGGIGYSQRELENGPIFSYGAAPVLGQGAYAGAVRIGGGEGLGGLGGGAIQGHPQHHQHGHLLSPHGHGHGGHIQGPLRQHSHAIGPYGHPGIYKGYGHHVPSHGILGHHRLHGPAYHNHLGHGHGGFKPLSGHGHGYGPISLGYPQNNQLGHGPAHGHGHGLPHHGHGYGRGLGHEIGHGVGPSHGPHHISHGPHHHHGPQLHHAGPQPYHAGPPQPHHAGAQPQYIAGPPRHHHPSGSQHHYPGPQHHHAGPPPHHHGGPRFHAPQQLHSPPQLAPLHHHPGQGQSHHTHIQGLGVNSGLLGLGSGDSEGLFQGNFLG